MKDRITQAELRALLHYNKETGHFTWAVTRSNRAPKGTVAGSKNAEGYISIKVNKRDYLAHRLAWLYVTSQWPAVDIDHENTVRTDNRWSNLREATRAQNLQNANRRRTNTSGVKGVFWSTRSQKWQAKIKVGDRSLCLGVFAEKRAAAEAYRVAAVRYFGEFARAA